MFKHAFIYYKQRQILTAFSLPSSISQMTDLLNPKNSSPERPQDSTPTNTNISTDYVGSSSFECAHNPSSFSAQTSDLTKGNVTEKTTAGDKHENPQSQVMNLPWMRWKVGQRVVVRRREPDGLYDALGELLEVSVHQVRIRTRRGIVSVPASKMVTGKLVPPPPMR